MNKGLSTYLDFVRITAAGIVFGHHALLVSGCYEHLDPDDRACRVGVTLVPYHMGHCAVVLFFVLSGYVITYVAAEREATLREFAVSRFARIYSVALPAIALTMCVDLLRMSAGQYDGIPTYQYHQLWKYLPVFLTFTTDFWFLTESTFTDGGFWSLCYEVWYYVLFAAVFYFGGWRRWAFSSLILLVVGFKLWALLPTWVLGSIVYKLHRKHEMTTATARLLVFSTLAAPLLIFYPGTSAIDRFIDSLSGGWISTYMRYSQWFVSDIAIALLFAASVFAAEFARLEFGRLAAPIKLLASFSFTLYLAHGPLLEFWLFYVKLSSFQSIAATMGSVALLGMVTERQNHRLRKLLLVGYEAVLLHLAGSQNGRNPATDA